MAGEQTITRPHYKQGNHSPDNMKFPDNSLMVRGTPPWHSAC